MHYQVISYTIQAEKKVITYTDLSINMLDSGVYSLEILLYQVQSPPVMAQKSNSLLGEIRSAVENLEVGYSRILGLCRCVSEVLQASST